MIGQLRELQERRTERDGKAFQRREAIEYERFPIETREEIGKGGRSNGSLN